MYGQELSAGVASKRLSRLKIKIAETGGPETRKMEVTPGKKGESPKKKVEQEVKEEIKEEIKMAVKEKVKD
jgi:hypothetical protein